MDNQEPSETARKMRPSGVYGFVQKPLKDLVRDKSLPAKKKMRRAALCDESAGIASSDEPEEDSELRSKEKPVQYCQAPKGNGVCGAIISRYNPYGASVCQPCAEALARLAIQHGRKPDVRRVLAWLKRVLEAKRGMKSPLAT